jgi:hypothetical protein
MGSILLYGSYRVLSVFLPRSYLLRGTKVMLCIQVGPRDLALTPPCFIRVGRTGPVLHSTTDRVDDQRRTILIIRLACTGRRSRNNTIEALEFGISVIIFLAFWPKYSSHRRCSPSHYLLFPTMTINLIPRRLLHQFISICGFFSTVYSSYSLELAFQNDPQKS